MESRGPETQKVEALRHLSETHRRLHQERRQFEYKVLLTTLSLYALTVALTARGGAAAGALSQQAWVIWVGFIGLAITAALYLRRMHRADAINISIAEGAEAALVKLAGDESLEAILGDAGTRRPMKLSALWWQCVTLLGTSVVSAYLVSNL